MSQKWSCIDNLALPSETINTDLLSDKIKQTLNNYPTIAAPY